MQLTNMQLREALDSCAAEPVHMPGAVQPFGCMIVADASSLEITHVSENCAAFVGAEPEGVLGQDLNDVLGRDVGHAIKNAHAQDDLTRTNVSLGDVHINDGTWTLGAFLSQGALVVEMEPTREAGFAGAKALKTLSFLMQSVDACENEAALFAATTRLLRNLTGYDRVMVYRFDEAFNGEVLAEDRHRSMESYDGLRFPHWDIPAQARDLMMKLPLRFIGDVDQVPQRLIARDAQTAPVDISLGLTRGVSPVHLEYLRNMGSQATLTLTVKIEGKLWGMLSLHHRRRRVPAPAMRELLVQFVRVFSTKLQVLQQKAHMEKIARVDALIDDVLHGIQDNDKFEAFAAIVLEILDACGLVITTETEVMAEGQVPEAPLLFRLQEHAVAASGQSHFDNLSETFPDQAAGANGCAGALIASQGHRRTLCVFRAPKERSVQWAGNPEKTIENQDGRVRLSPRGSFSTYIETVVGRSKPWSDTDQYFASRIWVLVSPVERQEMMSSLARQQKIMIDELNHRVRNILALIRSVSQQARRSSYGSLESYSRSLEARIQALASSHDLASGSIAASIPLKALLEREFEPHMEEGAERLKISGTGFNLYAEIAPIFALVMHEMVTNAVKYGALSNESGRVSVTFSKRDHGLDVQWEETGGPPVTEPDAFGFGTTLIQQAIPHEMDGTAELVFDPEGVRARFGLPISVFDMRSDTAPHSGGVPLAVKDAARALDARVHRARCLVVEDNFVIAQGLRAQIEGLGLSDVETVGNVAAAMAYIEDTPPDIAVLDVNLGRGETSTSIAIKLKSLGVPFVFVTGYGEPTLPDALLFGAPFVTKPAPTTELRTAIVTALGVDTRRQ